MDMFCRPSPSSPPSPTIDARSLLRWCVQMQGIPSELAGFKGRTNKLVDGCYSCWVGGCVVLAESLLGVAAHHDAPADEQSRTEEEGSEAEKSWEDVDGKWNSRPSSGPRADSRNCLPIGRLAL